MLVCYADFSGNFVVAQSLVLHKFKRLHKSKEIQCIYILAVNIHVKCIPESNNSFHGSLKKILKNFLTWESCNIFGDVIKYFSNVMCYSMQP